MNIRLQALQAWPMLPPINGYSRPESWRQEVGRPTDNNALVAQLDRALDYESRGREFESSRARHFQNFLKINQYLDDRYQTVEYF